MLRWGEQSDSRPIIIAVDDEILLPIAWSRHLRREFRIIPAANAARALHLLATMERVDLLTVDLHMPVMHGGELLRIAERCFPTVPRILVTGEQDNGVIDSLTEGALLCDVLYKPLSSGEIGQYLAAALSLGTGQRLKKEQCRATPYVGAARH